jgi:hypothetical protein
MNRSYIHNLLIVIILLVISVIGAVAATPSNYKLRIDGVRPHIDELKNNLDSGGAEYERQKIEAILKAIPQTEKIQWPGGSIETENQWLKTGLDGFAAETDLEKREATLTSISERLAAISDSVGELDNAIKAESTKDADKQKLAEILSREEYQKPQAKDESLFQKWWREFWEWVKKQFPQTNITPTTGPNLAPLKLVLQVLVFAVVIGLVGFLLWRFAPYFSNRFGGKTKKEKGDRVILGETIGENESASDLFDEAELLARQGDLRGAIRKGYIAVLCELGDRKIVRLARHKTNRDYLRESRKRERIYDGMHGLTNNFERNWYGLREAEPSDWEDFRARYHATIAEAKVRA